MSIPFQKRSTSEETVFVGPVANLRSAIGTAEKTLEELLDEGLASASARIAINEAIIQSEFDIVDGQLVYVGAI